MLVFYLTSPGRNIAYFFLNWFIHFEVTVAQQAKPLFSAWFSLRSYILHLCQANFWMTPSGSGLRPWYPIQLVLYLEQKTRFLVHLFFILTHTRRCPNSQGEHEDPVMDIRSRRYGNPEWPNSQPDICRWFRNNESAHFLYLHRPHSALLRAYASAPCDGDRPAHVRDSSTEA